MDAKDILSEMLAYYKYKVDNNLCTMAEIESAKKAIENNMEIYGTIEDFSKFYDVPQVNVRAAINRKLIDKPIRKIYYRFHKFLRVAPERWLKKRKAGS